MTVYTLTQTVTVTPGERYQAGGQIFAPWTPSTQISIDTPVGSTGWIMSSMGPRWDSYAIGPSIFQGSNSTFTIRGRLYQSGDTANGCQSPYIEQVVYNPQLALGSHNVRMNSTAPGGSSAIVSLTPNSLSFPDDPTTWSLDWGDGNVLLQPTLNSPSSHSYSLASGNSQTWTATFAGSNQAGSAQDTATVTLLRSPQIALTVNGDGVSDGQHLTIYGHNSVTLDLSNSQGYIENFSMTNAATGFSWSGQTWTGDSYNLYGASGVQFTVSNTGDGLNTSSMDVTFVPEPATLSLLTLGSLAIVRRRK